MSVAQFTLTVNEGKWFIAEALCRQQFVKDALDNGKIVIKGGTTTSCIAEILAGEKSRICGRITARGAVGALENGNGAHTLLLHNGNISNIDADIDERLMELSDGDVVFIGANLIDVCGNAAMMAGSPAGGSFGRASSALMTEGARVIITAGLEKLTMGIIKDAIRKSRRKSVDYSMGMSCGLFPIEGEIVTEIEAAMLLGKVDVNVIGRGGIQGAEGATVLQIEGDDDEVMKVLGIVKQVKDRPISGEETSLVECNFPTSSCGGHLNCCYANKSKIKL